MPRTLTQALDLHKKGRLAEAARLYSAVLAARPDNFDALHHLAMVKFAEGQFAEALQLIAGAMRVRPPSPQILVNQGLVLDALKRHDEALDSFDRAIKMKSKYAEAHNSRGAVLMAVGRHEEALESFQKALSISPGFVDAIFNRGNLLFSLKRFDEALVSYDKAVTVAPNLAAIWSNRGNTLRRLKRLDDALASYDRAIALNPNFAEAWSNRGMVMHEFRRYGEAVESCDRALSLSPNHPNALNNRAESLRELKRFDEAMAAYEKLMTMQPPHDNAFNGAANCAISICDWERRTRFATEIDARIAGGNSPVSSFVLFGYSGNRTTQLRSAQRYVADAIPATPKPLWNGETWRHDRIRIAYLSADFRIHATAFLMAGLFEHHDHTRFEVHGVSYGIDENSDMRRRLETAFHEFHNVREKSDAAIAQMLRDREIDIAIDLNGHTQESRFGILAFRPAPIAVNYLGYPGSMGAPFIDYVLADATVAPFEHQPYFTERIVHLPGSYQVNDNRRPIAENAPSRAEAGLPEQGFVFCSFNNNWKITPDVFDVWMRLLRDIEGSVLWLLRDNDGAEKNLRREAQQRGIDPSRLVFADRMPPARHLARHRLADLFLDTLPCNAHTTASDALWTGLPLLTCLGESLAGRVAASLVRAAGVPELVTADLGQYEALALLLAREPEKLREVRSRLSRDRDTCALFDTARFTRGIEAAYTTMWETWQRGERPQSFAVAPTS